jgi:hypothetical protein
MSFRLAAKPDGNQSQIVEDLRALGYDVDLVFREKKLYDILVSGCARWSNRHDVAVRVEIKLDGKKKLTPEEDEYWRKQKHRDNLIIATCTGDVLNWFGY